MYNIAIITETNLEGREDDIRSLLPLRREAAYHMMSTDPSARTIMSMAGNAKRTLDNSCSVEKFASSVTAKYKKDGLIFIIFMNPESTAYNALMSQLSNAKVDYLAVSDVSMRVFCQHIYDENVIAEDIETMKREQAAAAESAKRDKEAYEAACIIAMRYVEKLPVDSIAKATGKSINDINQIIVDNMEVVIRVLNGV